MAIRLALGSGCSDIMQLILGSGLRLGLAGCGIGIVAALFATRLLRSLVFEVDVYDPAILVLAALTILLVAILASVLPARRAASGRTDRGSTNQLVSRPAAMALRRWSGQIIAAGQSAGIVASMPAKFPLSRRIKNQVSQWNMQRHVMVAKAVSGHHFIYCQPSVEIIELKVLRQVQVLSSSEHLR